MSRVLHFTTEPRMTPLPEEMLNTLRAKKKIHGYSFPRGHILDFTKPTEFANDKFEFDENGRKFSTRVEKTVRKGEIAQYEQFLLFPQCFQEICTVDT